jgi:hypothetical protein
MDFSENWMIWLVLRHFLSTVALRDLLSVVVTRASSGRLDLATLFEECNAGEFAWNDVWMIRHRTVDSEIGRSLQQFVRCIVWQNDQTGFSGGISDGKSDENMSQFFLATRLADFGSSDLNSPSTLADGILASRLPLQASLKAFLNVFTSTKAMRSHPSEGASFDTVVTLQEIGMPAAAIATKHMADLYADVDAWDWALEGYSQTCKLLEFWKPAPAWMSLSDAWRTLAVQSRATALRIVNGPGPSYDVLRDGKLPLLSNPLRVINSDLDSLVVASHPDVDGFKAIDNRVAILSAPLSRHSHSDVDALHYTLSGKYSEANRCYWAALRRQLALGIAADAGTTKVNYARSSLIELKTQVAKDKNPVSFRFAIGLLIEAMNHDAVSRVDWSDELVDSYVDHECVTLVMSRVEAFPGCRRERALVAVELFREWTTRIAFDKQEIAVAMWSYVALLAKQFSASFESEVDVGRRSLRALKELAEKRPEFRRHVAALVVDAIDERMQTDQSMWGVVSALEAITEYADSLDSSDVLRIIGRVLEILRAADPARDMWPLVRPAIGFLISDPVKRCAGRDEELGHRILEQIIRFGLEQETEHGRLFFYLHDFNPSLLQDPMVVAQMQAPVVEVRRRVLEINSTRVTESIFALLLAPTVSGDDGVKDAIDGLIRVLRSVSGDGTRSPGLPYAYDCVLLLSESVDKLRSVMSRHEAWYEGAIDRLVVCISDLWMAAQNNPLIFAPFSFPPRSRPDPILVHNWAFASLRLAETVPADNRIGSALSSAATRSELVAPIGLARAARALARSSDFVDVTAVRGAGREEFYLALGRRLVQLETKTAEDAPELCAALVEKCLQFGPRELDASVFLAAARLGMHAQVRSLGLSDYLARLQNSREHRLALWPIVDLFREQGDVQ